MNVIYNVSITSTEEKGCYKITWKNTETSTETSFNKTPDITPDEMPWQWPQRLLSTGQKLFYFLDGENHCLQKAIEYADRKGDSLEIHLTTCKETVDWPFELLARGDTFLLSRQVHLVRKVSNFEASQIIPSINRTLKILFMASTVMDMKSLSNFEKEEEAIFGITNQLPIELRIEDTGSPQGLRDLLKKEKYDIVHLSGDAGIDNEGNPFLVMKDETGHRLPVYPEELYNNVFSGNPPKLLFLSGSRTADESETPGGSFACQIVENSSIPAVLGWGRSVRADQAIPATQMLYTQLSGGKSIIDAVHRTRYRLMKLTGSETSAWHHLRLYGSNILLSAIVKEIPERRPPAQILTHAHLRNSSLKVLAEGFVGRRRQIQASLKTLTRDDNKIGVLLLGTGGVGKSCLAGKLCERLSSYTLIIVHGRLNTTTLYEALNDAFIVAQDEKGRRILSRKTNMMDKLIQLSHSSFKDKKYLLILDDFECNLEGFEKGQPQRLIPECDELMGILLTHLTVTGKMTQVIITSRFEFTLVRQERDLVTQRLENIWLTSFNKAEQLKKAQCLDAILKYPDPSALQLLDAGKGNPRLMEWLNELLKRKKNSDVLDIVAAIKGKQEDFIRNLVMRQLIQYHGKELEDFLCRLSIFRIPVPSGAFEQVAKSGGISGWERLLKQGIALSLVEYNQHNDEYQVTPLLREELLKELKDFFTPHKIAFEYFYETLCRQNSLKATVMEELIYHGLECGEEEKVGAIGGRLIDSLTDRLAYQEALRIGEWILNKKKQALATESDAFLLNQLASTVSEMGNYHKAIEYLEKARSITRDLFNDTHPRVTGIIRNIGVLWGNLGEFDKAFKRYQKALDILKVNNPGKKMEIATLMNDIGNVFFNRREFAKSLVYFEEALAIDEVLSEGTPTPYISRDLNSLGTVLRELGQLEKAVDCIKRALVIDRALYREEHPGVAVTLNNLGLIWEKEGKYKKAIECFQQALNININFHGTLHLRVAVTLMELGISSLHSEELSQALDYFKRAFSINRALYGEKNTHVAVSLGRMGETALALKRPQEALEYFASAISIYQNLHGMVRWECARHITDMGTALGLLKRYNDTLEYYMQALSMVRKKYGEKSLEVAEMIIRQGMAWKTLLGNPQRAIVCYRQALALKQEIRGAEHTEIALVFNAMAAAFHDLGLYTKAIFYYDAASKILKKAYGKEHPFVTDIVFHMGGARHAMKEPAEAADLYGKALALYRSALGETHYKVGTTMHALGKVRNAQLEYDTAVDLYHKALAILQNAYGEKHHKVAAVLSDLGETCLRKGDNEDGIRHMERALGIYKKIYGREQLEYVTTLAKLGGAYRFVGKHKRAVDLFYLALEISRKLYEEKHPNVAGGLTNLGDSFNCMKEYRLAINCFEQAFAIADSLCIRVHPRVGAILNGLGQAWSSLGNQDRAIQYFEQALAVLESAYGKDHPQVAKTLDNIHEARIKPEMQANT